MASITPPLEDVYYERRNFNYDARDARHPLWVTERHFLYHLKKDKNGKLVCSKNREGQVIRSARCVCVCVRVRACA